MSDDTPILRFPHHAMATVFEVVVTGEDPNYARQAAQAVFQEIDRLEDLLSRFRSSSDVSQIRRLRPGMSIRVSLELFECLQLAQEVYLKTRGAFDPTVGVIMKCLKTPAGRPLEIPHEVRLEALSRVGMNRLILDPEAFTVGLSETDQVQAPLEVDLGAIGKGYAIDRAAEILSEWELKNAIVHAGTSTVVTLGSAPSGMLPAGREGWVLGAGGEWKEAIGFGTVLLYNEALSGSGKAVQGEHVIDPRTGYPARHHEAAWVIAPTGGLADALSTAFMVMSTSEVRQCCDAFPGVSALVIKKRRGVLGVFAERAIATKEFRAHSVQV